ncbi:MAG: hypothetical protein WCY10_05260 [Candidatus Omnitrophota bacterium]
MKILYAVCAIFFLASFFLCPAYAVELCESQDYYNLVDSTDCKIGDITGGSKMHSREPMFEILKNYPYEKKGAFVKLLERKIKLVDDNITQQQGQKRTNEVDVNIGKLEQTKRDLSKQLEMVNTATQDNWGSVRDQARQTLKEAANRLQEIE